MAALMGRAGFKVTSRIDGGRPDFPDYPDYPLLPGDLLVEEADGTFSKEAPGLGVGGFVLTPEQREALRPVRFTRQGLTCQIVSEGPE